MKKLCAIANVWGRHQAYIPLYVLSWHRAYPDVDIRIYLNDTIPPHVRKSLDYLNVYDHVTIIEDSGKLVGLSEKVLKSKPNKITRSLRWLVFEPVFMEYESLYISDIDIVIAKEPISLYEQHMRHCSYLRLPYSNIVRREPVCDAQTGRMWHRLTGLHFVQTKEYMQAIMTVRDKLVREVNLLADNESEMYELKCFRDEFLLYDLVRLAGLGLPGDTPPPDIKSIQQQIITQPYVINPEQINFRPHHGLHLGLARGDGSLLHGAWNATYKAYYLDFMDLAATKEYKEIERYFPAWLNEQIDRFHEIGKSSLKTESKDYADKADTKVNPTKGMHKIHARHNRRMPMRIVSLVRKIVNSHPAIKFCYMHFMKAIRKVMRRGAY